MPNNPRAEFEAKFSQPPYEFEMNRYNEDESWPGSYRNYHVQCTWEGWQAGAQAEREACAKICETLSGELTKWPDAYEGATAETQFIRGIGDCISKPFAAAIRDRGIT